MANKQRTALKDSDELAASPRPMMRQEYYSETQEARTVKRLEAIEGKELFIRLGGGSFPVHFSIHYADTGQRIEWYYEDLVVQSEPRDSGGSGIARMGVILYVSGSSTRGAIQIVERAVRDIGGVIVRPL